MQRYILIRFLQSLLALWVLSVIVFSLARMTGDPLDVLLPMEAGEGERERFDGVSQRHAHGYERVREQAARRSGSPQRLHLLAAAQWRGDGGVRGGAAGGFAEGGQRARISLVAHLRGTACAGGWSRAVDSVPEGVEDAAGRTVCDARVRARGLGGRVSARRGHTRGVALLMPCK